MYAKYSYNPGAAVDNILADLTLLLTGTTTVASLSSDCNKGNTSVISTTAAGWSVYDNFQGCNLKTGLRALNADATTYKYMALDAGSQLCPGLDSSNTRTIETAAFETLSQTTRMGTNPSYYSDCNAVNYMITFAATDNAVDTVNHVINKTNNFVTGQAVLYFWSGSGGAIIGGLTTATTYYILNPTASSFAVSSTVGGAAVAISSQGTGFHTFQVVPAGQAYGQTIGNNTAPFYGAGYYWTNIAYGTANSINYWVMLAKNTNICAYSTNGGVSWTYVTVPSVDKWSSVCYDSTNTKFYAVAYGGTATVYSSGTAGAPTAWTAGTAITTAGNWISMTSHTYNSILYNVVIQPNSCLAYFSSSATLASWTATYLPSANNWCSAAAGASCLMVIAYSGSGNTASTFSAYSSGTSGAPTAFTALALPTAAYWRSVCAGSSNTFVAISGDANSTVGAVSTAATPSWSASTLSEGKWWRSVCWDGADFIVVGDQTRDVLTSTDGSSWSTQTNALPTASSWYNVCSNGSNVTNAVIFGSCVSAYSTNHGAAWTTVNNATPVAGGYLLVGAAPTYATLFSYINSGTVAYGSPTGSAPCGVYERTRAAGWDTTANAYPPYVWINWNLIGANAGAVNTGAFAPRIKMISTLDTGGSGAYLTPIIEFLTYLNATFRTAPPAVRGLDSVQGYEHFIHQLGLINITQSWKAGYLTGGIYLTTASTASACLISAEDQVVYSSNTYVAWSENVPTGTGNTAGLRILIPYF
jgi:hypothetical protein